jgi:hypothetical protein
MKNETTKYVAFKSHEGDCVGATTEENYRDNKSLFDTDEDIAELISYEGPILDVNLSEEEYDKLFEYVMWELARKACKQ